MMTLEQSKALMQNFLNDLYNNGNLAAADEVVASPLLRGSIKRAAQLPRETFSDFRLAIEELISEDEKVVVRCTMHGTYKPMILGLILVDRPIEVDIIGIFRVNGNQIKGLWYLRDELSIFRQIGPIGSLLLFLKVGRRSAGH